jgi:murein DD-endopeptidase MepM/ murein hydrolase activator NlpD
MKKSIFITFILGALLSLSVCSPFARSLTPVAFADEAETLRQQIEERNANIKALEEEIKKYQAEADKTSAAAKTLANTIKTLQTTGKKLDTDIKLTEAKIATANLTIDKLSLDIDDKEHRIEESRNAIAESLRVLNERDSVGILHSFLGNKNIAKAWDEISQLLGLQSNLRVHIRDLDGTKQSLESDKEDTEEKKNELKEFSTVLSDQKKVVAANTSEKNSLLSQTKSQEAAYQALVKQRQAAKAALEKEVFDYESKLQYILNPSSIPSAGSAPFSWPTEEVYITQNFGVTSASARLYVSGSHNGTDFKALMGTPIHAIADGTVAGSGDTDLTCPRASFGRWILVKHDNGLAATFAHLSVISVKGGDKVKKGQIIGYSGNTGYSTGPHLHISVYPNDAVNAESRPSAACGGKTYYMPIAAVNAYLDPMAYFPKL